MNHMLKERLLCSYWTEVAGLSMFSALTLSVGISLF